MYCSEGEAALRTVRHPKLPQRSAATCLAAPWQPRCHRNVPVDRWLCVLVFRRVCRETPTLILCQTERPSQAQESLSRDRVGPNCQKTRGNAGFMSDRPGRFRPMGKSSVSLLRRALMKCSWEDVASEGNFHRGGGGIVIVLSREDTWRQAPRDALRQCGIGAIHALKGRQ